MSAVFDCMHGAVAGYVCLWRFLPAFCNEHVPVKLVSDDDGRKLPPAKYGQLSFSTWLLAWDQYMLAAAMTEQMSIQAAMTHKLVVAKVAQQASPEQGENLAVVYDMLVR